MSESEPGRWKFRTVHDAESSQRIALLLERQGLPEGADPCILAVREDWIRFLLDTPEGKSRLSLIARAPSLLAENARLREALGEIASEYESVPKNSGARVMAAKARAALAVRS